MKEEVSNRKVFFNSFILLMMTQLVVAQVKINQFDSYGKRHGVWIKYYKSNKSIRYKGKFNHGKEIGVFKYYDINNDKTPVIIREFNSDNNFENVSFYSKDGILQSKGKMQGKIRIGKWTYYHKDGKTILSEERYVNGKINGESKVYYANGKLTEVMHYVNGKLNGNYKRYSSRGFLYQDLTYLNGVLSGPAVFYDRKSGKILSRGNFKNNKRVGTWQHFENNKSIRKSNSSNKLKKN